MSTGLAQDGHDASSRDDNVFVDEKVGDAHHIDAAGNKTLADADLMNDAFDGENEEHNQGLWQAVKTHPKACFWAFIMCFTIVSFPSFFVLGGSTPACVGGSSGRHPVFRLASQLLIGVLVHQVMESFDMFLNGNFVAQKAFQDRYGVEVAGGGKAIETKWQSALFQAGQCGAFVGVFLAGPVVNKLGYRLATMVALVMMNATIFISFFVGNPDRSVTHQNMY